jgi:adenine phosphoribosyltransferase
MSIDSLRAAVRDVPDFPKKGILFKDITPVLSDPSLFRMAIDLFAERHAKQRIDAVCAIEARGFLFGAGVAYRLGTGVVPIRKKGKLPYKTVEASYSLEYGTATLAMHVDALKKGSRVLLIDDLLATGGTAAASVQLIEQLGGEIVGIDFLVELAFLKGREKLANRDIFAPIVF